MLIWKKARKKNGKNDDVSLVMVAVVMPSRSFPFFFTLFIWTFQEWKIFPLTESCETQTTERKVFFLCWVFNQTEKKVHCKCFQVKVKDFLQNWLKKLTHFGCVLWWTERRKKIKKCWNFVVLSQLFHLNLSQLKLYFPNFFFFFHQFISHEHEISCRQHYTTKESIIVKPMKSFHSHEKSGKKEKDWKAKAAEKMKTRKMFVEKIFVLAHGAMPFKKYKKKGRKTES